MKLNKYTACHSHHRRVHVELGAARRHLLEEILCFRALRYMPNCGYHVFEVGLYLERILSYPIVDLLVPPHFVVRVILSHLSGIGVMHSGASLLGNSLVGHGCQVVNVGAERRDEGTLHHHERGRLRYEGKVRESHKIDDRDQIRCGRVFSSRSP